MSDTLLKTANTLGHDLEAKHILQWHGDMHLGIEAARRHVAPNSMRLSDWAHVTGVTSQGPSGLPGLLLKEMPAEAKDTVLPWILQYCRISKQWPAFLFHVVWESLFLELEAVCGSNTIRKLQRQYFTWNADAELWDAPWRSAPDRIMPGTDAGSAPQESWHGTVLKPAFEGVRRKPAEVARILQEQIVQPQLRVLEAMQQDRAPFQDWPAIGQFLDQHILENDVQLKKEGRTSGKSLLAWGKHQRWEDPSGNLWMLVPTSKLKTDWRESTAKKKVYKDRALLPLQPRAVQHYAALITATSTHDVRQALASLDLYNCQTKTFKCWTKTAKALDDWRCVVSGPLVDSLWQEYQADSGPSTANQHRLWLYWGGHIASLWGPCEHAYCCMEHEGQSSRIPRCQKPGPKADHRVKQKPLPLQQYFPRSSLQFTIQLVHPWSQRLLPALLPCLLNTWSCGPCFVQPPLAIFTSQCAIMVSQFLPCSVFKFLILSASFGCPSESRTL